MLNRMIVYFLFLHLFPSGMSQKPTSRVNLVNNTEVPNDRRIGRMQKPMEVSYGQFRCKHECLTTNSVGPKLVNLAQARFTDKGTNDSSKEVEMESPAAKFSIFNLLNDNDEEDDVDEKDDEENLKEDEEDEEDVSDDDDFNFFGSDEIKSDKIEGTKQDSFLKQYHRPPFRMHHLVFPLLLAYKLKFFTVIPLLLGALVLLVGTTGVAGFFFALFATALAITTKTQGH